MNINFEFKMLFSNFPHHPHHHLKYLFDFIFIPPNSLLLYSYFFDAHINAARIVKYF